MTGCPVVSYLLVIWTLYADTDLLKIDTHPF